VLVPLPDDAAFALLDLRGKPEFLRRRRGGAFLAANLCGRCELILDAFAEAASAGLKELDGWRGRKARWNAGLGILESLAHEFSWLVVRTCT
jgi:hypothetical protein